MMIHVKRVLLTLASGSALAIAPLAYATVVVPATSHADQCNDSARGGADGSAPCKPQPQGITCPDGTIVDQENNQCVDLVAGLTKQLQALPPPPSLAGGGGLGGLPGGIPSLGTVNLPDVVLPGIGLGLVPNLNLSLQPQLGGLSAPSLPSLPAPGLPSPPSLNLNPLGLPPPPDLTPGIPFI